MLGGTYLLTKLLLPALEEAASARPTPTATAGSGRDASGGGGGHGGARVINVSSGGMYTVSGAGIAGDLNSEGVEPFDPTVV